MKNTGNLETSISNLVNKGTLSHILGRNVSTIDNWVRQGMPFVEKGHQGGEWLFDTAEVIAWRESRIREESASLDRIELDEAKRRKMVAEAGILELELKQKTKAVIERQEVEEGIARAYTTIKQRLRTIPERVIAELGVCDQQNARELLLCEIDDALLELSQLQF